MNNELQTNITLSAQEGTVPSLRFEILSMASSHSCSPTSAKDPSRVLVDQLVSNQSIIKTPVNATGTYCFVFDNQTSQSTKSLDISTQIRATGEQVLVARDGSANSVGLGLGALGLVVAIYGYSRKTIIPWE